MDTQKIFTLPEKVTVVADYREKEVSYFLKKFGADVNEINLQVGDFVCSDRIAVERKSHSDFISSIIDGRLFEQINALLENFETPIIIVEGHSNRQIEENAYKAALAKILSDGISVINTKNPADTAKIIFWLAKKEQKKELRQPVFKVGKKSIDSKILKEQIVASLPGVSSVISRRLLERFGSVEKIFTASEDELQKVKGIGKILAKKIKKIISENY
jgi:Fanconi anemia group M protein